MTTKIDIKNLLTDYSARIDQLKGSPEKLGRLETKAKDRILFVKWYTKHYGEIQSGAKTAKDFDSTEKGLENVKIHPTIQKAYDQFKQKIESAKTPNSSNSWTSYIPFAGIAAGALTGITSRLTDTSVLHSFGEKSRDLCRKAFSNAPVLKQINGIKQWEIKNFALALPLIPIAVKIIYDLIRSGSFKEAGKNITRKQVIALALIGVGILLNTVSSKVINSFDASGHMMLKTLLAQALSVGVQQATAQASPAVKATATALSAAYAASDAVLVHNTVHACHTVAESAAGVGVGLSLLGIARA